MPAVPKSFSRLKAEEIENFGYLGLSETVVFDMLNISSISRKIIRETDRWQNNYKKGLARREMELAEKLSNSTDPATQRELFKTMSISKTKVVDDNTEFVIDAPEWMKPKLTKGRKKGQLAENKDNGISVQPEVSADVS